MDAFSIENLVEIQQGSGQLYHEFLRVPDMSAGVYVLPTGADDPQNPHNEDEMYYIASGRGQIQVAGEDQPVEPGSIIYVAKHVEHHFHSITETLIVLVFFAPAES